MLGTLYSFAVDKIDALEVTPLVTLFLILDPAHPHFPTSVIPHRCHTEGLEEADPKSVGLDGLTGHGFGMLGEEDMDFISFQERLKRRNREKS